MIIVVVVVGVSAAIAAFHPGADTPNWELRWRSLDPEDRARISTAARSNAELTEPAEAELAAGLRRRDRRRRGYIDLAAVPFVAAAAALTLAGFIDIGVFFLLLTISTGIPALWTYLRLKHMDGTPRAATSPDAGL